MKLALPRFLPPLPLLFPATLSGVLVTLSFPVVSAWPLVLVALVPVMVAVLRSRPGRRASFQTGLYFGMACYVTMLWWIMKLIPSADVTIPWLMTPALLILVLYLAVYPAFFFLIIGAMTRYRYAAFVAAAPALWALLELTRTRGELAFPWGALGYALSESPPLIQGASIFGLFGLSFGVVLVNTLLSGAFVLRGMRGRIMAFAAAVMVVLAAWWYGEAAMLRVADNDAPRVKIAVVQPNIDLTIKWKREYRDSTFALIDELAAKAAAGNADLIVFPETSAPVYIENAPLYKERLRAAAVGLQTPLYIGFLDHRFDGPEKGVNIYNSSGVFLPDGRLEKYDKNHLLPFGEALPLSARWRWLRKVNFGQANFQPGPARQPLDAGSVQFTPLICFESVFPDLCRRGVSDKTQLLVNITNDGWFSDTPGPYQHAQMCILRAVEFRRYLVRSANTGVSMVVAPTGEVVAKIPLFEQGIILHDVAVLTGATTYARFGDNTIAILSMMLLVVAFILGRKAPAVRI